MLTAVLNDVLDISKIEAGQMQLDPQEFDLADCLETTCRPFAAAAADKGLEFSMGVSEAAVGVWLGDEPRIRQVLANLCANAVKFTKSGSVRVQADASASGLVLSVADSGIGIPQDRVPHLFTYFTQVDASTTRRYGGTGLGLAISRKLAALMGGALEVQSRLGHGSSFRLEVPLQHVGGPRDASDTAQQPAHPNSTGLRILAADDNETNRRLLQAVLGPLCSELVIANDGLEVVAAFEAHAPFDLVLMDIQMPHQDGVEATRAIRRLEAAQQLRPTPIIALTANVMREQLQDYLAAGMDGHVAKPIDFNQLFAAVEAAVAPRSDDDDAVPTSAGAAAR
jgi:CheY-like chemotaxis protein